MKKLFYLFLFALVCSCTQEIDEATLRSIVEEKLESIVAESLQPLKDTIILGINDYIERNEAIMIDTLTALSAIMRSYDDMLIDRYFEVVKIIDSLTNVGGLDYLPMPNSMLVAGIDSSTGHRYKLILHFVPAKE